MMLLSVLLLSFATVLSISIPGVCDQETNECMIRLSRLTSFDQCGMPPSTAATNLDPETLQWGLCACPSLVLIFARLKKEEDNCPRAKQYIVVYGDQVEKGCKIVEWAKKQKKKNYQFFWT